MSFDIVVGRMCESVTHWETTVGDYIVWYNASDPLETVAGWHCDCADFKYRKRQCKHILQAKELRCNWNWEVLAGSGCWDVVGDKCPRCDGPLVSVKVGV